MQELKEKIDLKSKAKQKQVDTLRKLLRKQTDKLTRVTKAHKSMKSFFRNRNNVRDLADTLSSTQVMK